MLLELLLVIKGRLITAQQQGQDGPDSWWTLPSFQREGGSPGIRPLDQGLSPVRVRLDEIEGRLGASY